MEPGLAKCGCDCAACPTFRENIRNSEERRICSSGWEKYLDLKLSPDKLRRCDGCSIPDPERKTFYLNCVVRKCSLINGMDHCAYCNGFPCDELKGIHSLQLVENRDDFVSRTGKTISAEDYSSFIEPYAGLSRLKKLRAAIDTGDIKEYKKFRVMNSFVPLINSGKADQEYLAAIHSLLTTLCVEEDISYARLETLRNKRNQLLKILRVIILFGVYNQESDSVELDGETFLHQKITSSYPALTASFRELENYGIHIAFIPLTESGWLTPRGGLRKEGWILRLATGDAYKGNNTLGVFKEYLQKLEGRYGNRAFRLLNAADLRIMIN